MLLVGFEPTISAGERPQTYALDRAATRIGATTNTTTSNSSDISGSSNSSSWIVCNIFLNKLNVKILFHNTLAVIEVLRRMRNIDVQIDGA